MTRSRTTCTTLENVEVQCTHCGVRMSSHLGSGERVRYFRCAGCHRWVSSSYTEVFHADAKVRLEAQSAEAKPAPQFDAVKMKLERWLAALEDQDPYRTLGVSPLDSDDAIQDRYRRLAFQYHPDRGGAPGKMQELNLAYERIVRHRERRARETLENQLPAGAADPA